MLTRIPLQERELRFAGLSPEDSQRVLALYSQAEWSPEDTSYMEAIAARLWGVN
jgi:hypothetical protein